MDIGRNRVSFVKTCQEMRETLEVAGIKSALLKKCCINSISFQVSCSCRKRFLGNEKSQNTKSFAKSYTFTLAAIKSLVKKKAFWVNPPLNFLSRKLLHKSTNASE